jgi:hypothetical protein
MGQDDGLLNANKKDNQMLVMKTGKF